MKKEEEEFEILTNNENLVAGIRAITPIVRYGTLDFREDGLAIREYNDGKYAVVDFFMSKKAFEIYKVKKETKLTVNLEDLHRVLKRVITPTKYARITTDGDKLIIQQVYENNKKRRVEKVFTLPLYQKEEAKDINIDELEKGFESKIDCEIPLDKEDLKSALKDIEFLLGSGKRSYGLDTSGEIKVLAENERVVIQTWNRYQNVITTIPRYNTTPNKDLTVLAEKEFKAVSTYEFGILNQMLQMGKDNFQREVLFRIGNNNPLQIIFTNPDSCTLKLILANREVSNLEHQYFEEDFEEDYEIQDE
jgi:hypothetical protein